MPALVAAAASLPWLLPPLVSLFRWRNSRSLGDVPATIVESQAAPLVSIVIPARNEARNIERCVRSVLASIYPNYEVIVVDDESTDDTGARVRAIAASDSRLQVVDAPELPAGWFGKQWACATGAALATGAMVVFTDADTCHAPDLLPRVVNAMRARDADLLSLAGTQETRGFWERVIQPQLFALLLLRYGGTENVSNATRDVDVIANGQFIAMRRDAYDQVGGHALVRDRVAEDMALAQAFFRAGLRVVLMTATDQLSTHMYSGLRELIGGWGKNIYAGGRHAAMGGAKGRAAYPLILIGWPLAGIAPPIVLVFAALGLLSAPWLVWSLLAVAAALGFWAALYRFMKQPIWYALLYPLGYVMLGYISVTAVLRGNHVVWKQRSYRSH